ncbi:MAG: septum site-determining protein Ssd [Streptomycetales bacterium]
MPEPARPLLVTADSELLDDLLRLSAAAGAEPEVAHDGAAARASWASAPLVVVGDDVAEALSRQALPRRPGILLVSRNRDDADTYRQAVELRADDVVILPDSEAHVVDRLADATERPRGDAVTVCVLGGRGGAGATTLAAALAVTGVLSGHRTLLLDGDPLGGGIDLVLGGEQSRGLRWPELVSARGRVSGGALHDALPRVDGLTVLSWDRGDLLTIPPEAMRTVLGAARRGSDLVVVDLPRYLDDASEEVLSRCTVALLTVPAEVRATAAAARVASAAGLLATDLRLVVRGPAPSGLSGKDVAASLGLPLAGEIRPEPELSRALERGEPPARRGRGPLAAFCRSFLHELPMGRRAAA